MSASNNPDSILYAWLKVKYHKQRANESRGIVKQRDRHLLLSEIWSIKLNMMIRRRLLAIPLSTTREDITFEDLTRGYYLDQS